MTNKIYILIVIGCLFGVIHTDAQTTKQRKSQMKDSVMLDNVTVTGKSKTQKLREGALAVNAIDVRSMASSIHSISELVDRTAGVKIREEGGMGSDFDLSINGMTGNSVRYFLDGVPTSAWSARSCRRTVPQSPFRRADKH